MGYGQPHGFESFVEALENITRILGFSNNPSWLISLFLLMNMYILIKS